MLEQGRPRKRRYQRIPAPRGLDVEKVKQPVFAHAAAQACAGLMTPFRRIESAEGIARIERPVAKKPISRAVRVIRTATSERVDHAARSASIFRRVAACGYLKLLYGVL